MTLKRAKLILILIVLATATIQACAPAEDNSADTIATAVAATLAAGAETLPDTAAPPPSPTWTIHPTVTASPPETNFDYAGVRFYFNPILADNITAGIEPGVYLEDNPWWSTPEHREYRFINWILTEAYHKPTIKVYPIADFRAINENVSQGLDALQLALDTRPADHAGLAVSDQFNAGQLYQSNVKYLDFQNGRGARWLAQYGQAYFNVGWPFLFYTYQGLTDDGLYYISVVLPVNHPYLPHPDDVTLDNEFYENYGEYRDGIVAQLESESENTFMPSLVLLDQLVASLLVEAP
jgi:hypothetical protein